MRLKDAMMKAVTPREGPRRDAICATIEVHAVKMMVPMMDAIARVITAAEIIDGQDSPPVSEDVDYLHKVIREARETLAEADNVRGL